MVVGGTRGAHIRASGCSNARVALAVRTSSCCLLKGPATDPIQPNSRCHPPPPQSRLALAHAYSHMCSTDTHTHHTHAQMSVCVCVSEKGGTWNYLLRTKSKIRKKNASSNKSHHNAEKNPQPHPRNTRKTLFLSFRAVKSVSQRQK